MKKKIKNKKSKNKENERLKAWRKINNKINNIK